MSRLADEFRRRSDAVELALRELETAVRCGMGRDAISERLTDCSVALAHLAEETNRLAKAQGNGRRAAARSEDDDHQREPGRPEESHFDELAEDIDVFDINALDRDDEPGEDDPLSENAKELAALVKGAAMQDGARLLQDRMADMRRHTRLATIRGVMRFFWHGYPNPWEMMVNGIAITRRYVQRFIPGLTQTEVSKMLDETRAATSAREKRHDAYLEKWGVKNPKAADPGLKSPDAVASYKKTNGKANSRKRGERRKKLRRAFQTTSRMRDVVLHPETDNENHHISP